MSQEPASGNPAIPTQTATTPAPQASGTSLQPTGTPTPQANESNELPTQPTPAPAPTTTPEKKRDLTAIGSMIAALAAAVALGFTAWTSYYQVETSKDALAQSAEDSEKDLQKQAALVSTWIQESGGHDIGYFANRSPDPISQVYLGLTTGLDGEVQLGIYRGTKMMASLGDIPPCSRVTISGKAAGEILGSDSPQYFGIAGFTFVDARGRRWGRSTYEPLKEMKVASTMEDSIDSAWRQIFPKTEPRGDIRYRPGSKFSELPAPEPLKNCSADDK
ncbi:hypothetical protein ACJ6WF_48210 [Streptomyces sp. MMS24-I2-30]|uniref:hypothetical protein n=1 Tax=Streptomyces sp. MMS24-I2-30 TaxID=3351564 RepID=UPI003896DEE5